MKRIAIILAAALSTMPAFSEEDAVVMQKPQQALFTTLPLCRVVEGEAEVMKPNGEWSPIEEGKFYPLGSSFRTKTGSRMVIAFGKGSSVTLSGETQFGTRSQVIGCASRTVVLNYGKLSFKLNDNMPEGAFFVTAPGFLIKNPAGEFNVEYDNNADLDKATIRCVTGSLGIEGKHFNIPAMHAANEIVIRTSHDYLSTFLYGKSGNYIVKLDQGIRFEQGIDDDGNQKLSTVKSCLDWHLSPSTRVVINRAVPAIGERMSVHTMAFNSAGECKSECSFCEGRAEVNSGELVVKEKTTDGDQLVEQAAEATETVAATDVDEISSEETQDNDNTNESSEEEEVSDSEEE